MTIADWILFIAFLVVAVFGIDRHLCLKDVEKDLKLYLNDLSVARDLAEGSVKVHYQATVSAVKTLIRIHFER
jgi:hypothetical protein